MPDVIIRKVVALLESDAHERQIAAAIVLGELGAREPVVIEALAAAQQGGPDGQGQAEVGRLRLIRRRGNNPPVARYILRAEAGDPRNVNADGGGTWRSITHG